MPETRTAPGGRNSELGVVAPNKGCANFAGRLDFGLAAHGIPGGTSASKRAGRRAAADPPASARALQAFRCA
eukprot:9522339-Lingulodinium_polyedra.AAC.1